MSSSFLSHLLVLSYQTRLFVATQPKIVIVDDVKHEIDLFITIDYGKGYTSRFIFECKAWFKMSLTQCDNRRAKWAKRLPERYGESQKNTHHSQGGNRNHCSTVEERVHLVSQMLAQPPYGLVSQLSCAHHVSRQTLYRWTARGMRALEDALGNQRRAKKTATLPTLVLTLLIETHASYRGIQTCLKNQQGIEVSLGTIASIVKEAGQRAQTGLSQQQSATPRILALDEQYSSQRGKAYLNGIDVHSGQVWASVPPVEVDGDSWTLLLWYLQEQGVSCLGTVSARAFDLYFQNRRKSSRCHRRSVSG